MSKKLRGYNSKARQVVKTSIDNAQTNEIKLEFSSSEYGATDNSNLIALPSKKRDTKLLKEKKEKIKFLSKAQRKRLEKIVDKKKKKQNRASLLESLSQVQASPHEVQQLTTISAVQTLGLRKINGLKFELPTREVTQQKGKKISSIAGAKKRLRLLNLDKTETLKKRKYDPNIVGLEESSEESTESESDTEMVNDNDTNHDIEIVNVDNDPPADALNVNQDKNKNPTEITAITSLTDTKLNNNTLANSVEKDKTKENKKSHASTVEVKVEKKSLEHQSIHIEFNRDPKIQVARLKLPILGEEQRIMELINENEFVIVAGETGCGKTTQIPQFLYEAGYAESKMIGVTEPRRVATVTMSQRVGHELGLSSKEVSYLMRYEGNVTKETKIKFMTDGVLLKEIQSDFYLTKYSVIIIDEAHERSVYTDVLIGLLSRIVPLRKKKGDPLRLIIMSATLRLEDFAENTRLFREPPPVIKVETRQFPVTVHFNRRTHHDYMKEAFKKTVQIHTRLPDGGILVFVTGQQEVNYLVRKLKAAFPYRKCVDYSKMIANKLNNDVNAALDSEPDDIQSDDDEVEKEMKRARKARRKSKKKYRTLPKINLDDYDMPEDDGEADLLDEDDSDGVFSDSDVEEDTLNASIKSCRQPLWVLPLYSMLDSKLQARVFKPPPVGSRLCVISTDVAETSLTIPAIRYVVDTGKKKMRIYNHRTGASAYRVVWTSKASAEQRAGRAGRVSSGHAYRLYSSAVFQHECPDQHEPDLCRRPVDDILLTMKSMGIDKVVNFPFPTPPDRLHLRMAEKRLEALGILEKSEVKKKNDEEILKVTPLGKAVSVLPVIPRYGRILALSHQQNLLPYTVALVAALTVPEVLSDTTNKWPATGNMLLLGDMGVLLRAVFAAEQAQYKGDTEFCAKNGLREKAIQEIRKLRKQLTAQINLCLADVDLKMDPELQAPDDRQARFIRQLVLCGLGDQVARKISLAEVKKGEDKRKYKYAYHCGEMEDPVYLHSESILKKTIPDWVVYQELYETGPDEKRKMVIKNVTAIEPEWLPIYVQNLCNLGDPLTDPPPRYDEKTGRVKCHLKGTFGKGCWELPTMELDFPDKIERYKWFACFLLEGVVFPKLKRYTKSLLLPPSIMVKTWAKLQPWTEELLRALISKRAGNREALKKVWEEQKSFLQNEYLKWLPKSAHNDACLNWPPL